MKRKQVIEIMLIHNHSFWLLTPYVAVVQDAEESGPEFVAEDEIEESDLSDIEDWTDRVGGGDEEESPSDVDKEEMDSAGQDKVLLGKRTRKSRPHVEIEYETEAEPRTKLKA